MFSLNTSLPMDKTRESLSVFSSHDEPFCVRSQRSSSHADVLLSSSCESLSSVPAPVTALSPVKHSTMMIDMSVTIRGLSSRPKLCFVGVYVEQPGADRLTEVGLTEGVTVSSSNCVSFTKKFSLQYHFHQRQMLRFEVHAGDSTKTSQLVGLARASLGEIVYSNLFGPFERPVMRADGARRLDSAVIQVNAEEVKGIKENILLQFAADHLPAKVFNKHAFFFELHRVKRNGELEFVYRSLDVTARRNVTWQAFTVNMQTLCSGGSLDEKLRFSLWRRRRNGVPVKLISFFDTTVRILLEGTRSLRNMYRIEKRATVRLTHLSRSTNFSFLDQIHANTVRMHCVVAVDFTASNGNPSSPKSLHHLRPGFLNQYQTALKAILEVVQDYDSDKIFPAFGFGAAVPPKFELSNRFNLNGHPTDPSCTGIEGVLMAYERTVRTVRMHEPSNFEPVIRHVSKMASSELEGRNYYILLMLTSGVVSDMSETVNALVEASSLPISIIIIGVGDADFSNMQSLDTDDSVLISSDSCPMDRDIVQFIPFNDTVGQNKSNAEIQADLAREVLREIPDQFLSYMAKLEAFSNSMQNLLNASGRTEPNNCSVASLTAHHINRSY